MFILSHILSVEECASAKKPHLKPRQQNTLKVGHLCYGVVHGNDLDALQQCSGQRVVI